MGKPACNCIHEVNKNISEKLGKDCHLNMELLSGGILIDYYWDEKTRAGNTKQKSGYIMPSYCPFCGKPYSKEG